MPHWKWKSKKRTKQRQNDKTEHENGKEIVKVKSEKVKSKCNPGKNPVANISEPSTNEAIEISEVSSDLYLSTKYLDEL
ncbi:hypothetical protein Tco_0398328 [Tanacetum coccineum]